MKPHLEGRVLICFISLSFLFFLSCSPPPTLGAPDPDPKEDSGPAWEGLPGMWGETQRPRWPVAGLHTRPRQCWQQMVSPRGRGTLAPHPHSSGTSRAKVSSAPNSGPAGQSHSGRAGESRWPDAGSSNHFCKRLDGKYFLLRGRWGSL